MRKKLKIGMMGILTSVMMASAAHAQVLQQTTIERLKLSDTMSWIKVNFDFDGPAPWNQFLMSPRGGMGSLESLTISGFSQIGGCEASNGGQRITCTYRSVDAPTSADSARGYIELSVSGSLQFFTDTNRPNLGGPSSTVSATYQYEVPKTPPPMIMQMAQYVDLIEGEAVDRQLRWHPFFPIPAEAILNFEIAPADAKHPTGLGHEARLPAGLSMSTNGRLTGTLTEVATTGTDPFWLFLKSTSADYTENVHIVPIGFRITAAATEPEIPNTGGSNGNGSETPKIVFRMTNYQR